MKKAKIVAAIEPSDLLNSTNKERFKQYDKYDLKRLRYTLEFEATSIQEINYLKQLIKGKI
ncbi:MAG: hypothetical protein LBC33_02970 [Mycoplasmataceae bacterium]|jgi:hypothetical protein|nr:hypothetical protein [Mycoplasmataceae bacterium]